MKTALALLTLCIAVANAATVNPPIEADMRAPDGRAARFRVVAASSSGFSVQRVDEGVKATTMELRWKEIDLGHLQTTNQRLYDLYRQQVYKPSGPKLIAQKKPLDIPATLAPGAISINVAEKQSVSKGNTSRDRESEYTSRQSTFVRELEITVKKLIAGTHSTELRYWFVAQSSEKNKGRYVWDEGSIALKIDGISTRTTLRSQVLSSQVVTFAGDSSRREGGGKPEGWIVEVRQGELLVARASSSPAIGMWFQQKSGERK